MDFLPASAHNLVFERDTCKAYIYSVSHAATTFLNIKLIFRACVHVSRQLDASKTDRFYVMKKPEVYI